MFHAGCPRYHTLNRNVSSASGTVNGTARTTAPTTLVRTISYEQHASLEIRVHISIRAALQDSPRRLARVGAALPPS